MQGRVALRLAHNLQLVTVRWFSRETKCSATAASLTPSDSEFISYLYVHICTRAHIRAREPALGRPELPSLSAVGEGARFRHPRGGEVRWGEVIWAAWNFSDTLARTHTHVRTYAHKLPRRRRGNNSPVQFFLWGLSLPSSLSESLTARACRRRNTHTHTLSPRLSLPLLLYFCFFPPPSLPLVNPWDDRALPRLSFGPPMASCQPGRQ